MLIERLDFNGFSHKLGSFGKFKIYHRARIYRKIPFTGKKRLINPKRRIKSIALGQLRALEEVTQNESRQQALVWKVRIDFP
jgi:nucleoid DNA-binding protein